MLATILTISLVMKPPLHKMRLISSELSFEKYQSLINLSLISKSYLLSRPTCCRPGSFGQFIVSKEVSRDFKVVLGGQGGDELFGGYTRYLLAYFDNVLKAIEGKLNSKTFIVSYDSIIPNLPLKNYKPLIQEFFLKGCLILFPSAITG